MRKGKLATAGSKMLYNFTAPFDAAVLERLDGESLEPVVFGEFSLLEPEKLPKDAPILCNDVMGHARKKAAREGLCHIRPTYGTVSRYGLIPTACSMDQIGVIAKDPKEALALLEKIAGQDDRDGAMYPEKSYSYGEKRGDVKIMEYEKIANEYTALAEQVLEILAYGEISNNISRYDGIKFGYRAENFKGLEELYLKTRTEGFGVEAKVAALVGSMVLSVEYYFDYYDKALKIRRLIRDSIKFDGYDVLRVPVGSPLAALTGLPSLSYGEYEYIAKSKDESALLSAWEALK
jgi:aspartyl-tRNA(Asn)/glutamyl-tRNA(Gln) amidotransferase subunit A